MISDAIRIHFLTNNCFLAFAHKHNIHGCYFIGSHLFKEKEG